jgi:predicted HicB family RNase H-like nuclease
MANHEPQRYSRHVYFNADDQDYIALCTEFPHLSAFADSPEEALAVLDAEIEEALAIYVDEGWPLPRPEAPPQPQGLPSGRFVVRLPRTVHHQLVNHAKEEGVSLNQLVNTYVAAGLAGSRRPEPAPLVAHGDDWLSVGRHRLQVKTSNVSVYAIKGVRQESERDVVFGPATAGHPQETTHAVVATR